MCCGRGYRKDGRLLPALPLPGAFFPVLGVALPLELALPALRCVDGVTDRVTGVTVTPLGRLSRPLPVPRPASSCSRGLSEMCWLPSTLWLG